MCSVCDLFAAALQFNYQLRGKQRERDREREKEKETGGEMAKERAPWCAKIIISMRRRFRRLICKFPFASFAMRKSSTKKEK